ncbi:MAG: hypothetical protein HOU01_26190, partial [Streptomycetaceae bacterium]|nr:hypothetical protein [Streptomycetaceae bacterium]
PSAEYVTGNTAPDTRANPSGPPARPSRKPLVLGVTALVIAVIAAGVVAVVVLKGEDDKSDNASGPGVSTATPTAPVSPGPQPGPGGQTGPTSGTQPTLTPPSGASRPPIVPPTGAGQGAGNDPAPIAGYTWTHDPAGFSLFVPNGWTRSANGNQIDYTDPNKRTLLRIGTDTVGKAPLDNFNEIDANFAKIKQNYQRLQLGPHPIGVPGWDAAVWEFTWKGNPFNPQSGDLRPSHAMDLGIRTDRGSDYAIYVASFEDNWAPSQKVFNNVVANFRQY